VNIIDLNITVKIVWAMVYVNITKEDHIVKNVEDLNFVNMIKEYPVVNYVNHPRMIILKKRV
jgi:Na+-transporting NADH:ubiquinone oxidoreductase subunit NqrE